MQRIEIKGPKEKQYAEVSGNPVIRYSRTTEKKPVGKKKKWTYKPDNKKEDYAKNN